MAALTGMTEMENAQNINAAVSLPWLNRLSDLLFLLATAEEKNSER
jgi:cob(I)alamin adenosyltransferase